MCNIPHCCLPQESGPCLSPSVTAHPLRPATRQSLGRPSPHQQADRPRAHPPPKQPKPVESFQTHPCEQARTPRISHPFKRLSRSEGQVTHVLLTRSPLTPPPKKRGQGPFDLHVLSTPPAFVLSQDQTLQKNQKNKPHTNPNNQKSHQDQHAAHSNSPENQSRPNNQKPTPPPSASHNTPQPLHSQKTPQPTKRNKASQKPKTKQNGTKNKHTIEISNNTPTKEAIPSASAGPLLLGSTRETLASLALKVKPGIRDPDLSLTTVLRRRSPRTCPRRHPLAPGSPGRRKTYAGGAHPTMRAPR